MVSSSMAPSFGRQPIKFGHIAPSTQSGQIPTALKSSLPEPALMIEVKAEKQAAEQGSKATQLVKPLLGSLHSVLTGDVPKIIITGLATALTAKWISKNITNASAKSFQHELAELESKKRAESIGSKKGELSILPTIIALSAGPKLVEEASKTLFSLPTETYKAWIGAKYKKP